MQSNHTGGSNAIMVPDGTYTINLGAPDDEANTGGALEESGDLDIFSWNLYDGSPVLTAVSITGGTRDGCIIQMGTFPIPLNSNSPNNKERILEINDIALVQSKVNVTLTNLTFQNGIEPTGSGAFLDGGAIWYDGSDATAVTNVGLLTLHNVKLSGNTCAGGGGGVNAQFGSLRIESTSIVRANTSQHKVAGGVRYTGGNTIETQYLSIDDTTIGGALAADGNQAIDATFGGGGGIDSAGGGTGGTFDGIVITNSTLQNNVSFTATGTTGGGGFESQNGPKFTFTNVTATGNTTRNNGGAFLINGEKLSPANTNATVTMSGVTITGNTADADNSGAGDGGGIYELAGSLVIQNNGGTPSHIDGNAAINGGGIFVSWVGTATPAASLTMTNGTIGQSGSGNNAKNNGGGLAVNPNGGTAGTINVTNVSFTNNTANSDSTGGGDGGGIFVASGSINSLSGCTIDSNVANGGNGDGIKETGGAITGAGTINVNGGDSISITGGTFTSTSGTLNLTGNFDHSGGTFTHNSGTFIFNGSAAQSTGGSTATTFNVLTDANTSAALLVNSNTNANGNLTVNANAILSPAAATVIGGSGTLTGSGTAQVTRTGADSFFGQYTITNKTLTNLTVEYVGAASQTSSVTTYSGLKINNASGVTLGAGTTTVNGLLNLTSGNVTTGANTLAIGSSATRSRTSGHIIGNEKKTYGGTGAFIFDVGTANGYSPVDSTVTAGTGDLTVAAVQGAQPNVVSARSLQRYWTLTEGGAGITADLTFHYLDPTDVMGNEANYQVLKVVGGARTFFINNCPAPCVDGAANTFTINGVTDFSDWTAGEARADLQITSNADAPDPVIVGNNITYTINSINNGPDTSSNVTVTNAVPAQTTFVSVNTPAGWSRTDSVPVGGTGDIVFAKSSVANAETAAFQVVVNVNSNATGGSAITDNAVAASTVTTDPTPGNNTGTAMTLVHTPPMITSADNTTFVVGSAGSFTVTTTGFPAPSIAQGGVALPSGVMFTSNGDGTGTLSGTPAAGTGGTYAITFTATNAAGSTASAEFHADGQ